MLPELKRLQLVHNQYYAADDRRRKDLLGRLQHLQKQINGAAMGDGSTRLPPPPLPLPRGWEETRTNTGELYYYNAATQETSWSMPGGGGDGGGGERDPKEELAEVQAGLREAGANARTLSLTLYLTGAKPDQVKLQPDAKPGSTQEIINALLSTVDPDTNEPYIHLKPGRPDWDTEFKDLNTLYGREDIGVVFCGAPMIAAALKQACEKHSHSDQTVFRLHKENF